MVDDRKNEKSLSEVMEIQRDGAPVKILAVRTQEEREIAEQTVAALEQSRKNEGKATRIEPLRRWNIGRLGDKEYPSGNSLSPSGIGANLTPL